MLGLPYDHLIRMPACERASMRLCNNCGRNIVPPLAMQRFHHLFAPPSDQLFIHPCHPSTPFPVSLCLLLVCQGLAELHGSTGDHEKLAEACAHLVEGWAAAGQADKVSHFRRKLAQALLDQGKRDEARRLWREVLAAAKQV